MVSHRRLTEREQDVRESARKGRSLCSSKEENILAAIT